MSYWTGQITIYPANWAASDLSSSVGGVPIFNSMLFVPGSSPARDTYSCSFFL